MTEWSCTACGGANPAGMRFCGHCGAPSPAEGRAAQSPAEGRAEKSPAEGRAEKTVVDVLRSFVAGQVADRLVDTGGNLTEERRLVTALFADVSGFTALADRLDPEQLLDVIDPIISRLSSVVARYEGYVDKFAGDALLAFFGAPVSHEDDASRALSVALEMHAELAQMLTDLPPAARDLTLHIGVNTGHVVARVLGSEIRMDYAVLGEAVIVAQRLEAAAPAGETYVGEVTRRLARDRFTFEPMAPQVLKGKREPVAAWRLTGDRTNALSEPEAGLPVRRLAPILGRDRETAVIDHELERLAAGRGGVVLIESDPGLGKTRLTQEARVHAERAELRWLEGRSPPHGRTLPYWTYADMVRALVGIHLNDTQAVAVERLSAFLDAWGIEQVAPYCYLLLGLPAPAGTPDVAGLGPEAFRDTLHRAVASVLQGLAAERPTVLAIEDVHWADPSSVALTVELAGLTARAPLLLFLTGRPEAAPVLEAVSERVGPERAARIHLGPLGMDDTSALVRHMLEGPPPEQLMTALAQRAGGNPFFVEEVVHALRGTGVLATDEGTWRLGPNWDEGTVPPTVEGALSARIDALPGQAALLLKVASVLGRRTRLPLLRAVAADVDRPDEAVAVLLASGLLERDEDDDTVSFHHALAQQVAYGRLLQRQRRELHLRVAESAESLYGAGDDVIELLAEHLYRARAGTKALAYLRRAAARARRLFANEEAMAHLRHAIDLVGADPALREDLDELELELAGLLELRGRYDEALDRFRSVAARTGDLRAQRGVASILRQRGEWPEALTLLRDALSGAGTGAEAASLWLERGRALIVGSRFADAIDALETGLALAGEGDTAVGGQLLLQLARAEEDDGRLEDALGHARRAQAIFDRLTDAHGMTVAWRVVGDALDRLGRLDEAAEALREGLALAERVGSVEELGGCLVNLGLVELHRGRLQEAIACDRRAIEEFERVGHASGRAVAYSNLAEKLLKAGDLDGALDQCRRTLEITTAIGDQLTAADALHTMALVLLAQGDADAAAGRAEEAAALFRSVGAEEDAEEAVRLAAAARRAGEAAPAT